MTVSTRNTFLTGAGALALIALGGFAYAGGGMSVGGLMSPGGGGGAPGTTTGGHGGGKAPGCCGGTPKGPSVIVPGVNVAGPNVMVTAPNVTVNQGSIISNTQSFLNTSVVGGGGNNGFFVSGGGGYYAPQGVAPSAIGALNVEGNVERYTETVRQLKNIAPKTSLCSKHCARFRRFVSMTRAHRTRHHGLMPVSVYQAVIPASCFAVCPAPTCRLHWAVSKTAQPALRMVRHLPAKKAKHWCISAAAIWPVYHKLRSGPVMSAPCCADTVRASRLSRRRSEPKPVFRRPAQ